jgi:uncharacterized protein YjbI with pentapeptide repeats
MSDADLGGDPPGWDVCTVSADCTGIRIEGESACLAHATPEARRATFASLAAGGKLDLRGTPIDSELLRDVISAMSPADGKAVIGEATFARATFTGPADFAGARFTGPVDFDRAVFTRGAYLQGGRFDNRLLFRKVDFTSPNWLHVARFDGARFGGEARFDEAKVRSVLFGEARFDERVVFDKAQLAGRVQFAGTEFGGDTSFRGSTLAGDVTFGGTRFRAAANFERAHVETTRIFGIDFGARFDGTAKFDHAVFRGRISFQDATFSWSPSFSGAHFTGWAGFREVCLPWGADFARARFEGGVDFTRAQFNGRVEFRGAEFGGDRWFEETQFFLEGDPEREFGGQVASHFDGAKFTGPGTFGPVTTTTPIVLDRARFGGLTTVSISGPRLSCVGATFSDSVSFQLRFAEVVLDRSVFAKPSVLAFARNSRSDETRMTGRPERPRLLSLRHVDAGMLTLVDLDLAACVFQEAHNLDKVRIQGDRAFADSPGPWRLRVGRKCVPVWQRFARRQTLAEEHLWRRMEPSSANEGALLVRPGWHPPRTAMPSWVGKDTGEPVHRLTPRRLATQYRALRKAEEDTKNEPGAADFYYGEMEMRRHSDQTPWSERVVLWLYWLVAGYGLRGLRALGWLIVVMLVGAVLFHLDGIAGSPPKSFGTTLLYTADSMLSLAGARRDDVTLTEWGRALSIGLRLLGPVLIGLALLSIRNRVKR